MSNMEFEIKDYNSLKSFGIVNFTTLDQIKNWLLMTEKSQIAWIDFMNMIVFVTEYGKFGQR